MKKTLMTPEAIKEIESLIPDHQEALMRWGDCCGSQYCVRNACGCLERLLFRQ